FFFFSSRRRHTRFSRDWSSDVCSSDLAVLAEAYRERLLSPQRAALADRLRAGVASGELRPDLDPELGVDLLLGPIQMRWSLGLGLLTEDYADAVLDAALDHLLARGE